MITHFTLVTGAMTVGCRFQFSFNISNRFFQNFALVIVCWKKNKSFLLGFIRNTESMNPNFPTLCVTLVKST